MIELYSCTIGSRAYNLTTPDSDTDIRGVVLQDDLSYYFGLNNFEQQSYPEDEDHEAWSAKKFIALASKGNTQTLEMLWCPEHLILTNTYEFREHILKNRDAFMTKEIYNAINGYAYSEHLKAIGQSSRDLGDRRKDDLKKYGYSARNASHCIRLLHSGIEALKTGEFPVRLTGQIQSQCMQLKLGQAAPDQYKKWYTDLYSELQLTRAECKLPDKPNFKRINEMLVELHKDILFTMKVA